MKQILPPFIVAMAIASTTFASPTNCTLETARKLAEFYSPRSYQTFITDEGDAVRQPGSSSITGYEFTYVYIIQDSRAGVSAAGGKVFVYIRSDGSCEVPVQRLTSMHLADRNR